jgi:hypothetical protein
MVQVTDKLIGERGILPNPNVKPGKVLPPATAAVVK